MGAGEVMLTNADRDGTLAGIDLVLVREGSALVDVPLIAAGGANSLDNVREAEPTSNSTPTAAHG